VTARILTSLCISLLLLIQGARGGRYERSPSRPPTPRQVPAVFGGLSWRRSAGIALGTRSAPLIKRQAFLRCLSSSAWPPISLCEDSKGRSSLTERCDLRHSVSCAVMAAPAPFLPPGTEGWTAFQHGVNSVFRQVRYFADAGEWAIVWAAGATQRGDEGPLRPHH
jgi:hypothetical protein